MPTQRAMAVVACVLGFALTGPSQASAGSVLDEWDSVKAPAPPAISKVSLDPNTTALISMDFNQRNCNPQKRSRCADVIPIVEKLITEARANGMIVVHTYTPNMAREDIVQQVGPKAGELVLQVRGDKFHANDLEGFLKGKGVKTVLLVGTSANGAVLYTAIGAVQRGLQAIVPVDTMPADTAYQEQFTVWEIANGPGVREGAILTRSDLLSF